MPSIRRSLIGLLCLAILHTGCAGSFMLPREELQKLDGFQAGAEVPVQDAHGQPLTFTSETPILMILYTGEEHEAEYAMVTVRDGVFLGTTSEGRRIEISLEEIECVEMIHPRSTGSTLTAVAIGAAAVAVVLIVWAVVVLAAPDDDG